MSAGLGSDVAEMIEPVLGSMGYEVVDVEFGAGGLLRVTIDVVGGVRAVQVEDCEQVSHQLTRMFAVENVEYDRLEISSPGLDRPLKKTSDFARFVGEKVSLRLRHPVGGRKQFTGVLLALETALKVARESGQEAVVVEAGNGREEGSVGSRGAAADRWVLVWSDDPEPAAGRKGRGGRGSKRSVSARGNAGAKGGAEEAAEPRPPQGQWLTFTLDQVEKARLMPKLVF